jgi:putative addiction module component (TIGR02574 family)
MSVAIDKIVSDALGLPPQARAFVAERLIESLDAEPGDELSPLWKDEVRRRCQDVDQDLVELHNAEDAFARARGALK